MQKKLILLSALILSLIACADMQNMAQKLKPTAEPDPNASQSSTTQPHWLISMASSFTQVLTSDNQINLSTLSSLEQTTECKSLVTEMQTSESLGQILGMVTKLKLTNLISEVGVSFQNGATAATNKSLIEQRDKAIVGLFARGLVWLPMQFEKLQGEAYHSENMPLVLDRDSKDGKLLYPKAEAMLAKLTANLPPNLPYDFQNNLFILKKSGKNAKAVQGGYIYLDKGLLDKGFEDRAHFALAHEISHLLQRHETKHTQAKILDTVTTLTNLSQTLASYDGVTKITNALTTTFVMRQLYAKHGAGQELGSDTCALKIMGNANLPKKQIQSAVRQFMASQPRSQFIKPTTPENPFTTIVVGVLKPEETHPTTDERIKNLEKQMLALNNK